MSYTNDTITKPDASTSKIADAAKDGAKTAKDDARTTGTHLRENAGDVVGAFKESTREWSEDASGMAGRAMDSAGEMAAKAGVAATHAKERAQETASDVVCMASDLAEETTALIRRHPLTALAAGVALGVLLGQVSRRPSNM